MTNDSRHKMIQAAAALFAERGYSATSFQDVIARSGAPRGSIYHHFPGGKAQLATEALRWYGERTRTRIAGTPETGGPETSDAETGGPAIEAVAGYFAATSRWLVKTGFRQGCPIAGVALDLGDDEPLHGAVAATFQEWQQVLEHAFLADGSPPESARALATLVIASAEGALILARVARDIRPYDDVAAQVLNHLRAVTPRPHERVATPMA